jgi:hypothetical protein
MAASWLKKGVEVAVPARGLPRLSAQRRALQWFPRGSRRLLYSSRGS